MTTKGWVVLTFLVIALVCFLFVGFEHGIQFGKDLLGFGLASMIVSFLFHIFMSGPELKG